eukprot:CAMPEP_0114496480 /NCGR_PEP_ID=MMETSP0109-20121206/5793_1 /TAXON_ID=29199 /ORGANISM="Chlorarachnion reptans, Strain CCCM449" /LENGTH=154 /DNA_ID=CAMNT_0001673757 /DNA_START=697 /DNA_END=1158 /DNA_ORIENTATION=+
MHQKQPPPNTARSMPPPLRPVVPSADVPPVQNALEDCALKFGVINSDVREDGNAARSLTIRIEGDTLGLTAEEPNGVRPVPLRVSSMGKQKMEQTRESAATPAELLGRWGVRTHVRRRSWALVGALADETKPAAHPSRILPAAAAAEAAAVRLQ